MDRQLPCWQTACLHAGQAFPECQMPHERVYPNAGTAFTRTDRDSLSRRLKPQRDPVIAVLPYVPQPVQRRIVSRAARRRACATAFLGTYLLATIGYPIELPSAVDASVPFPCQHHQCGCHSAEQCWSHCCCFTHEQKLAWAKAHRVSVPEHLVHGDHDHVSHVSSVAVRSDPSRSCVAAASGNSRPSSARSAREEHTVGAASCGRCATPKTRPVATTSVVVVQALKCRGLATYWCSVGAVVPPPPALNWEFDWTCRGQLLADCPQLVALDDSPPTPPPRV